MKPGQMALTVMPLRASSLAAVLVKPSRPAFGRGVVGLADVARLADEGAHVDDLAPTLLRHVRQDRVHRVEGAVEVYLDHLVPVLHRELLERAVYVYAGVVDKDVYAPVLLYRLIYEPLGLLRVRDISLDRDGLATSLGDLVDQLLRRFLAARVVDHDLGSSPRHLLRYRPAKAPARPRNHDHRFLQSAHAALPSPIDPAIEFIDRGNQAQTRYGPHINPSNISHVHKRYNTQKYVGDWLCTKNPVCTTSLKAAPKLQTVAKRRGPPVAPSRLRVWGCG